MGFKRRFNNPSVLRPVIISLQSNYKWIHGPGNGSWSYLSNLPERRQKKRKANTSPLDPKSDWNLKRNKVLNEEIQIDDTTSQLNAEGSERALHLTTGVTIAEPNEERDVVDRNQLAPAQWMSFHGIVEGYALSIVRQFLISFGSFRSLDLLLCFCKKQNVMSMMSVVYFRLLSPCQFLE